VGAEYYRLDLNQTDRSVKNGTFPKEVWAKSAFSDPFEKIRAEKARMEVPAWEEARVSYCELCYAREKVWTVTYARDITAKKKMTLDQGLIWGSLGPGEDLVGREKFRVAFT